MMNLNRSILSDVIVSVDWGFTNPGVMQVWAVDSDRRMYLVHEVFRSRKLIDWWAQKGLEIQAAYRPSVFVCDPSEPAYIQQLNDSGLHAIGAYNDQHHGIQAVAQRLAIQPDGRPRLFLFRDAVTDPDIDLVERKKPWSTDQEIDGYVWARGKDDKPVKEEPVKLNDHGCDALRYAVAYVDDLGGAGEATWAPDPFADVRF
jgi:hypothetical protein